MPALGLLLGFVSSVASADDQPLRTGREAMGDWTTDAPGVRRHITVQDLPPPGATNSAQNHPKLVPRPEGAWPKVPEGFEVGEFAHDFTQPRKIVAAPNGDVFVAESKANRIRIQDIMECIQRIDELKPSGARKRLAALVSGGFVRHSEKKYHRGNQCS